MSLPGASGKRESGQSKLRDRIFAGKHKCSSENHDRPFLIEWDATDMSSFESVELAFVGDLDFLQRAFALGSVIELNASVDASLYGFGAGLPEEELANGGQAG
jgi:hypothetical protein